MKDLLIKLNLIFILYNTFILIDVSWIQLKKFILFINKVKNMDVSTLIQYLVFY